MNVGGKYTACLSIIAQRIHPSVPFTTPCRPLSLMHELVQPLSEDLHQVLQIKLREMFSNFVIRTTGESVRDKELATSTARSHAARLSHLKRKNKSGQPHKTKVDFVPPRPRPGRALPQESNVAWKENPSGYEADEADQYVSLNAGTLVESRIPSDALRNDPFNAMPGKLQHWSLLDCWVQRMMPPNKLAHSISGVANVYTTYLFDILQHELIFDSAMASIMSTMPVRPQEGAREVDMLEYKGKALTKLATTLSCGKFPDTDATDAILVALSFLCTLERRLGNMAAFDMHSQAIQRLVAARGGLDALGHAGIVKARLLQWDIFWEFSTDKMCFPEHRLAYAGLYLTAAQIKGYDAYMALPAGFMQLAKEGSLPDDVLELLVKVNAAWTLRKKKLFAIERAITDQKYSDFHEAVPSLGAADAEAPSFAELVSVAIVLFCTNGLSSERTTSNLTSSCRIKLAMDLPRLFESDLTEAAKSCVFWMTCIAIDAWKRTDAPRRLLSTGVELLSTLKTAMKSSLCSVSPKQSMADFFHNRDLLDVLSELDQGYAIPSAQVNTSWRELGYSCSRTAPATTTDAKVSSQGRCLHSTNVKPPGSGCPRSAKSESQGKTKSSCPSELKTQQYAM